MGELTSREKVLAKYPDAVSSDVNGHWFIMGDATVRQSTQMTGDYFFSESEAWDDVAFRLEEKPAEPTDDPYTCSFTESGEHSVSPVGGHKYTCNTKALPLPWNHRDRAELGNGGVK